MKYLFYIEFKDDTRLVWGNLTQRQANSMYLRTQNNMQENHNNPTTRYGWEEQS